MYGLECTVAKKSSHKGCRNPARLLRSACGSSPMFCVCVFCYYTIYGVVRCMRRRPCSFMLSYTRERGGQHPSNPPTHPHIHALSTPFPFHYHITPSPPHLAPTTPTSGWRRRHLLERIPHLVIPAHPMLPPLLRHRMLHHALLALTLHKPLNKPGIPQLRSNAEVFAAAHQSVGFAALSRGGNAVGIEVLLFAAGYADKPTRKQCALEPAILNQEKKKRCRTYRPPQTSPYSLVTTFPVTIVSPLGANPHPPGPNALFRIRLYLISGR